MPCLYVLLCGPKIRNKDSCILYLVSCSVDDLDLFYGKVKYEKTLTHKISLKVLKIGNKICLNDYMKICEKKRSRSLFDL